MGLNDEQFREMSDKLITFLVDIAREKHITQQMISDRTGFAQSNVARIERCAYSPTLVVFLKYASAVGVRMELITQDETQYRYDLKPAENDGYYVCTDLDNQIICVFEMGKFNETQKFSFLQDITEEQAGLLPSILRKMGEWIRENHYDKAIS